METKIFGEFKLRMGQEVAISNYCRLKFILSITMREREIFGDLVKLTVNTFKEDVERILVHMIDIIQLSKSPFQRANKATKEASTGEANEDEVESTEKI